MGDSMMRGMMGGPMGRGGMMPGNDAEAKKRIKTLTRTDFLIQFLWKPTPAMELPDDPEQRKAKLDEQAAKAKELFDKMNQAEAQKSSSAVTMPSAEEIEKASKQKTSELEAAITKALTTLAAPDAAAGGAAVQGAVAPGAAPAGVPAAPAAPAPPGAAKPAR
jgi:type IV pilus assembly protein PilM